MKRLFVGLGNPGSKYENTRHNIGFIMADRFVESAGAKWKEDKKYKSLISEVGDTVFLKPQTFMNLSGEAVSKVMQYHKILSQSLYACHDDVDLEFPKIKFQYGIGSAGHHGVENIMEKLGTKDFWRIRIGVGRPDDNRFDVLDWVLSRLNNEDLRLITEVFEELKKWFEKDISTVQN